MKCVYYDRCGGCDYSLASYQEELNNKLEYLNTIFKKEYTFTEIIGNANPYNYRNKAHLVAFMHKGKVALGFYEEKSKKVIPVTNCALHIKEINEIIDVLTKLLNKHKIRPATEKKGVLKDVVIRYALATKEAMLVLVTESPLFPGRNNLVSDLKKANITTIVQNIQARDTTITLGEQTKVLFGKGFITDKIANYAFKISPLSFYQVNSLQTEKLYKLALQLANFKSTDVVIDAYSGISTIGILASSMVKEVIAVEANSSACKDARINCKLNNITNLEIVNSDALKFMQSLVSNPLKIDCIILDPPRSGATEAFLGAITTLKIPKIVYISCGPDTLYRDINILKNAYEVKHLKAVDMFSRTKHVETLVVLFRKNW